MRRDRGAQVDGLCAFSLAAADGNADGAATDGRTAGALLDMRAARAAGCHSVSGTRVRACACACTCVLRLRVRVPCS
ncbi:hypothetical protein T492DRAFT_865186 [Pavlovales sp. CCMP2436]|nr:hypothetical protein T492DRAFT_865186 [Pavlovales sp. CCMP2436]